MIVTGEEESRWKEDILPGEGISLGSAWAEGPRRESPEPKSLFKE